MNNKDLVLLGGGHTHVLVIKALAMKPIAEVRVTLISERALTPYSGMLPGYVAGHYALNETNIDLNSLCRKAGVRWIQARSVGVDAEHQRVRLEAQPDVDYDVLSIDVGSTPNLRIPGAKEFAVGVKPIAGFQAKWRGLLTSLEQSSEPADQTKHWGVIGAGAGGVELVLAMAHRLRQHAHLKFHLIYRGEQILSGYPPRLIRHVEQALRSYGIALHPHFSVSAVHADGVTSGAGEQIQLDASIWCTGAVGASWLASSGLAVTQANFIQVNRNLQSVSHANVFAVGDIAENVDDPRPKAGVFAVRQAPFLAGNLRDYFAQKPLTEAKLQSQFLSLLALGDKLAVGSRNGLVLKGRWVWRWKDSIDQKFMQQFGDLAVLTMPMQRPLDQAPEQPYCGGCGSKLGPELLSDNLTKLAGPNGYTIEDAAVWQASPAMLSVQSIDGFRSFISDESRCAQVAVVHALSDLYAMGATPLTIQAWINLPIMGAALQQRDHLRMLQGIKTILDANNVTLVGGHSSQGAESHLGIVANGEVSASSRWSKGGAQDGDLIVMSKALGSGVLLAADMQGATDANAMDLLMGNMLESNALARDQLALVTPSAVTDITGFGLVGHLLEMLDASSKHQATDLAAELTLQDIPLLPTALELATSGWRSSLFPEMKSYLNRCSISPELRDGESDLVLEARKSLLVDPQTSGGLLACLTPAAAEKLIAESAMFKVIGTIVKRDQRPQVRQILLR
ncbi:selenide, water dikinase SelD [Arenicella xantha]|uniref:Selenophosphate synthase n=1 Tax=Arenicella xantha TaxID=644221 RepID=A0A395JMC1_9GAMM|nr:selenide, water dikinase SelD [Arenicella xantha]RBP51759.1 selenophosphate synthase [Arenicella xantha]